MKLRVMLAGTPEISARLFRGLLPYLEKEGHECVGALTQPDRQSGRGRQWEPSPVKQLMEPLGIPLYQPESLGLKKNPSMNETLKSLKPDVMIVVAYGLIIPKSVLAIPTGGCWNVHVSLLPRWRGAAPIQRAIEAGDSKTGVSLMQMDEGLDTGDILSQRSCPIALTDTAQMLHDRLADEGLILVKNALSQWKAGTDLLKVPQAESGVTYAEKITKAEGQIDWTMSASELQHKIMAFNPWPVCFSAWRDQTVRFWTALPTEIHSSKSPGTFTQFEKGRLGVVAGDGRILEILTLQLPGKKVMSANDFLNAQAGDLQ